MEFTAGVLLLHCCIGEFTQESENVCLPTVCEGVFHLTVQGCFNVFHQSPCGGHGWWNMIEMKIFHFHSHAVCLISISSSNALFSKCSQMLTGARLCFWNMFRSLVGQPPLHPTTTLCSSCSELWKRESVHRNNVFEMMEAKAKDRETIWEETKCVNERRWFISSTQTNCYNSSAWLTELETDKSQDLAFGCGCGWSAEIANENFPTVFVSLVLFLPPTLFYFFSAVTFCIFLSDVSLVPPLVSQLVTSRLWIRKDRSLFLVRFSQQRFIMCDCEWASAASLKIGRRDKLPLTIEAELVLLCQWWKVTEDICKCCVSLFSNLCHWLYMSS